MIHISADNAPDLIAETPEHCHACNRIIEPGQSFYLTIGNAMHSGQRRVTKESCRRSAIIQDRR